MGRGKRIVKKGKRLVGFRFEEATLRTEAVCLWGQELKGELRKRTEGKRWFANG